MSAPSLSIIIVAYHSGGEVADCLRSLPPALDGDAVEVFVVDNSADEKTRTIVGERCPRVSYLAPEKNVGFGRANNIGYARSSGRVVLFLNPDTICSPVALEHCLKRLQSDRSIGLISPRLVQADGTMDLACRRSIPTLWDGFCRGSGLAGWFPRRRLFSGYNLTHLPEDGTYDVGAINGAFMMGRREVFEEVGLFDERFFMYGDDLDLCIRVAKAGYRIVYDGRVQITHLKGVSVAKDFDRMSRAIFDANRDVFLKHFNPSGSAVVRWKYVLAFEVWKRIALFRGALRRRKVVRPL